MALEASTYYKISQPTYYLWKQLAMIAAVIRDQRRRLRLSCLGRFGQPNLARLGHNISPLLNKQLVLKLETKKASLKVLERLPSSLLC